MIIIMKKSATRADVEHVTKQLKDRGLQIHEGIDESLNVFGVTGDTSQADPERIEANRYVESVVRASSPYKRASRMFHPEDTIVEVNGIRIGEREKITVTNGPCPVEGKDMTCHTAYEVKDTGEVMLRGKTYKPRTSLYAFQGMGIKRILALTWARKQTGFPVVTELMSADKLGEFIEHVDVTQIGAKNMQNFNFLKVAGKTNKPMPLKRGLTSTVEGWIISAECILSKGNTNVMLCERGIRTLEPCTRSTPDLNVVPIIRKKTCLSIIVNPSHATGNWKLAGAVSLAVIVADADGLTVEVHDHPECARNDSARSLKPGNFKGLVRKGKAITDVIGRTMQMKTHVAPSICSDHAVIPPSKNMAHYATICASPASGTNVIENVVYSQDIKTMIAGIQQLGADIRMETDQATVTRAKDFTTKNREVFCCEFGSALRFFISIFPLRNQEITFTGQGGLLQCPQKVYENLFHAQGLTFRQDVSGITIRECPKSGDITLQGDASSQLISGLLFTLPLLQEDSTIHILPPFESRNYVGPMPQILKTYGMQAFFEDGPTIRIPDNQQYTACDHTTEEDYSQLTFFAVPAACSHDLAIIGVRHGSKQGDKKILSTLRDFGIRIGEVKNGCHIYRSSLRGYRIDLADCPDSGPILAVLATYSPGNTSIYNVGRLRIEESDRIEAMEQGLCKFGVGIHSTEDEILTTDNSSYTCASEFSSHNDHRIVMVLSVAATYSNISCTIDGAQAIQKSYPTFSGDLQSIGGEVELLWYRRVHDFLLSDQV